MTQLKLFLQFEGHRPVELIQVSEDAVLGDVLAAAAALGAEIDQAFVFAGDDENPLQTEMPLCKQGVHHKARVHVHRCKHIHVSLNYADQPERHHNFTPSTTVDRVRRWYVEKLEMPALDATEHVLQLTGTTDRPEPDVQIGALAHGHCGVGFSLVPIKRVEG